ncbi:hypothetical protein GALMADRAFT_269435 [Galerina marginata CBS 339.88]|uniref:DUF6533 domain-containing protein n=1 Tax=Galerina marginata (strain CBS 339.88) TaxID=685588 RepID=A0A067SSI2_GALM3|nr:hypothetical protein GALMADRAFT_269435 [Galerina marginata CBS 339.88]
MSLPYPINIPKVLEELGWLRYLEVSSMTLILFDYSLTFNEEVRFIWSNGWRKKPLITGLFVINRYLPIVAQSFNVYSRLNPNVTYNVSKFAVAYWLIGTSISQLLVTDSIVWLCVCALYGNAKKIRYSLLALFLTSIACGILVLGLVGRHSKGTNSIAPGINACLVYTPFKNLWEFWVPILVYETTTLILVSRKYYEYVTKAIHWNSPLLEVILKNTFLYLAIVFGIYIGSSVLWSMSDPLSGLLDSTTVAMLSILGNRMLFNLREEGMRGDGSGELTESPESQRTRLETLDFS